MYDCLFPTKIQVGEQTSIRDEFLFYYRNARQGTTHLRIWLRINNEDAQSIPWELIHHYGSFIVSEDKVSIVRLPPNIADEDRGIFPKEVVGRLKILIIVSSPSDSPLRYAKKELNEVKRIWTERLNGNVDFDVLITDSSVGKKPTAVNVQDSIGKFPNIIHYIGHSGFYKIGMIVLSKDDGSAALINEDTFANMFNAMNVQNLALIVLNSCESGAERGFNGIAKKLLQRHVPAVVAMRYSVLDSLQPRFASVFYRKLIDFGYAVESAMIDCRHKSFLGWAADKIEFAAPVLYLASDEKRGVILDLSKIHGQQKNEKMLKKTTTIKTDRNSSIKEEARIMISDLSMHYQKFFAGETTPLEFWNTQLAAILQFVNDNAADLGLRENDKTELTTVMADIDAARQEVLGSTSDEKSRKSSQLYIKCITAVTLIRGFSTFSETHIRQGGIMGTTPSLRSEGISQEDEVMNCLENFYYLFLESFTVKSNIHSAISMANRDVLVQDYFHKSQMFKRNIGQVSNDVIKLIQSVHRNKIEDESKKITSVLHNINMSISNLETEDCKAKLRELADQLDGEILTFWKLTFLLLLQNQGKSR